MKRLLMTAAVTAIALSTPAFAADVGVSVNIGQPGFYGRLDIGGYPPPALIYAQPRFIPVSYTHLDVYKRQVMRYVTWTATSPRRKY